LIAYAPRRRSLELQRDSDVLLLLIPEAGGRGKGVLSGKVFEYLAAERPILAVVPPEGAAAELIRDAGAGVVVAPDDVDGMAAVPRTTVVLLGFFAAFLLVYLVGYFNLTDSDSLNQWAKGLVKWAIHFAFLAAAVVWITRRGQQYFWRSLGWFCAGIVTNGIY